VIESTGGLVEEAVEDGDGDGAVVEHGAPGGDAAVGGKDDRAVLVAAADDLEEVAAGYLPFDPQAANLMFMLVSRR
jgi:hypothetical protein